MTHLRWTPLVSAAAAAALAAPACIVTDAVGVDAETDTTTAGPGSATTTGSTGSTGPGVSSTTSPDSSASEPETGSGFDVAPGLQEYVGTYTSGFGYPYFTPCGQTESWYVWDLPSYEFCESEPYVRLLGVFVAGAEGDHGDRLEQVEVLEGPCLVGSCEAGAEFSECTDFETACMNPVVGCDPLLQDCEAGSKCTVLVTEMGTGIPAVACAPNGTRVDGESCTREDGTDDCAAGLYCLPTPEGQGTDGFCRSLCAEGSACDVPEDVCMAIIDGYGVCVPM